VEERKAQYRESAEKAIGAQALADKRKEYLRKQGQKGAKPLDRRGEETYQKLIDEKAEVVIIRD
jgi:hypothetical protein